MEVQHGRPVRNLATGLLEKWKNSCSKSETYSFKVTVVNLVLALLKIIACKLAVVSFPTASCVFAAVKLLLLPSSGVQAPTAFYQDETASAER